MLSITIGSGSSTRSGPRASSTRTPPSSRSDSDRGRIYRVVSDKARLRAAPLDDLAQASDETLVKALASPNLWWRRTAQRLLVDRKASAAIPALVALAADEAAPLGRLHALWTLDALGRPRRIADSVAR